MRQETNERHAEHDGHEKADQKQLESGCGLVLTDEGAPREKARAQDGVPGDGQQGLPPRDDPTAVASECSKTCRPVIL